MSETVAPTPERLRRGQWDRAEVDQKTQRKAWRDVCIFETLFRQKHIDRSELEAAQKYEKHYQGSLGYDCRMSDDINGFSDIECRRTYHSQMIAKGDGVLNDRQRYAIVRIIEDKEAKLWMIGHQVTRYRDRSQAHAAATQIIQLGLEQLAYLWGLKERKGL